MPHTHRSLSHASRSELDAVMRAGVKPRLDDLAGWEFRGFNTPFVTQLLGIRKFKKGFYRTPRTSPGTLDGYNVRTRQNSYGEPWLDVMRRGEPLRHGFYGVVEPIGAEDLHPNALLIDYSLGANPPYDPSRLLRDYLTQVDAGNSELFLGKAYAALGTRRIPLAYFVLERLGPSKLHVREAA